MKNVINLMICLIAFATQAFAQETLPISSRAALTVYALERAHYGEISLEMERDLMLVDGEVATTAYARGEFLAAKSTQEKSAFISTLSINYSVRSDIELGTPAVVRQVWYDVEDNPLFEGEKHAEFVLVDGRKDLDQDAYYMNIYLSDTPIKYDQELAEAVLITQWGERMNLRVDEEYFFFPPDYAGQEGTLVLRDEEGGLVIIDTKTGKTVSTRELTYRVGSTWVQGVYTITPWNSDSLTISPWYYRSDEVFEVSGIATLTVEPYAFSGTSYPYLMFIQNIDTEEVSQIPSTEAGDYQLDSGAQYRIWFDWDAIFPQIELVSVTDTQIPGDGYNVDHQVAYRLDITSNAGDVFVPFSKVEYQLVDVYNYEQNPPAGVKSVYAPGAATSVHLGEEGVWVREGETVRLSINLYFVSSGQTSMYKLSLDSLHVEFEDGTQVPRDIGDNGRQIVFYYGKG